MGTALVDNIKDQPDLVLAGGSILPGSPSTHSFYVTDNAHDLFRSCDVVIDFTSPKATCQHIEIAVELKKRLVIGTTGLSEDDQKVLQAASKHTAILFSANMSLGVNVLAALVEQAAASLPKSFDIEIFEMHHKAKLDAPSGTALLLGKAAAQGRHYNTKDFILSRQGQTGARPDDTIGFSALRGGDITGDHTVGFYGAGERIELTHKSTDRNIFARGALQAARWIADKDQGLYSMKDVLGLS